MATLQDPNVPDEPSLKPRRRVALRAVFGILLLIGMAYGWSAMGRQKAAKQSEAIEAITAAGGGVYLDYQWKDGQVDAAGKPQQAAWLRRLVGPESLDRAVAVDLSSIESPGGVMRSLQLLPYLVDLNANGTSLDDAALETICRLAGLTRLDLSQTAISDSGVARLQRLTSLSSLSLASTGVSDQGVEALMKCKQLQQLDLSDTQVSDAAVTRLRRALPKCVIVSP